MTKIVHNKVYKAKSDKKWVAVSAWKYTGGWQWIVKDIVSDKKLSFSSNELQPITPVEIAKYRVGSEITGFSLYTHPDVIKHRQDMCEEIVKSMGL